MRKFWRCLAGIGLVILGIIGLILPIMPGWVFLVPGLVILSEYCPPLKRFLDWAMEKPLLKKIVHWVQERFHREQAERQKT